MPILSKFMNVNKYRGFANRNESLRVAYVDEVETLDKGSSYYSKLVKVDKMEKTKDQVLSISFHLLMSWTQLVHMADAVI